MPTALLCAILCTALTWTSPSASTGSAVQAAPESAAMPDEAQIEKIFSA